MSRVDDEWTDAIGILSRGAGEEEIEEELFEEFRDGIDHGGGAITILGCWKGSGARMFSFPDSANRGYTIVFLDEDRI